MEEIRKFDFADSKTVKNIINNYILTEETLVKQLYFTTSHGTTIGGFREKMSGRECLNRLFLKNSLLKNRFL